MGTRHLNLSHHVILDILEKQMFFIHSKIDVQTVRKHEANKIKRSVNTTSSKTSTKK